MTNIILRFDKWTKSVYESVNNNIASIQTALKAKGFGHLLGKSGPTKDGVDGVLGAKTKAAIIAFQKANGIKPTGFVGKITAPKLGVQPMQSTVKKAQHVIPADTSNPLINKSVRPIDPQYQPVKPVTNAQPVKQAQPGKPVMAKPDSTKTTVAQPVQKAVGCPSVKNSPYLREFEADLDYYKRDLLSKLKISKDPYEYIDELVSKDAKIYVAAGVETRTACEIALTGRRPSLRTKNVFVVDTLKQTIYLFGKPDVSTDIRPMIARDVIQSGLQKQKNDAVSIANAFITVSQRAKKLGVKSVEGGRWLDPKTNKDVTSSVWDALTQTDARMLPAGQYEPANTSHHAGYAGKGQNVLMLKNWDGKLISQALHGYVENSPERVRLMQLATGVLKDPNNDQQMKEFIKMVDSGGIKLEVSFGCIGLTERFLVKARPYFKDSVVMNLAEDKNNYLVQNTETFFNDGYRLQNEMDVLANAGAVKIGGEPQVQASDQNYA